MKTDLAVYAKAMSNGYPCEVRAELASQHAAAQLRAEAGDAKTGAGFARLA